MTVEKAAMMRAARSRECMVALATHMREVRSERAAPRREAMRYLRAKGLTYKQIARQVGGTPDGVRGSLRKMQA